MIPDSAGQTIDKRKGMGLMANSANDVLKMIKDKEIEWVDLRFTDPKGKWQHLTMVAGVVGEDELTDGLMFDGSSIEGWKAINESDMILKPDLDAVYDRSVLGDADADPGLRHRRAVDRRALCPRSALDREARRGLSQDHRHRRHRLCRPRSRVLHVRRCAVREQLQRPSYYKIDDIELPTNTGTRI